MAAQEAGPRLDDQVCFALYAATRAVTALYRPLLDDLGLTYPQYLVMLALWEHDELAVNELGRLLHLDSGTLSPLLKRLEKLELVERRRRADDERSVRVTVAPAGRALRAKAVPLPGVVGEAMGLDERQLDELRRTLRGVTESVNDYRATLG
ncbi:MarR family winged helix-turn-helix transcriptional regulator [Prauserella muralis]|uniref:MarR family transcriptional regulator n=1 Tax=Prauserella muralis TaxID=588067 RepID=A0A2V4ART8_9PSEU|nr:MarR family winged helix-turn-helix transcriptional regulator [Prauserella muralis]PXY22241.1 MarR family transcriptional regulator [Prauserella muralis]TWE27874.1 MarR family transcriptional regulator [Prauserella muralis]